MKPTFPTTLLILLSSIAIAACDGPSARVRERAKDDAPAGGIDEASCKFEAKYQCSYECIETSKSPADRNECEVKCGKRPLSYWNGKIAACTP
jgi:hypothetical protein